jgi:hypothetical protein
MTSPKTFDEYVSILKDSAGKMAKEVLRRELAKRLPFLFFKFVNPFTEILISHVVNILVRESEFAAFFAYIDLRVSAQGRTYQKAVLEHKKAQDSGTEEEKKRAEENLINAFRRLAILSA